MGTGAEGLVDKTAIVHSLHAILKPFLLRRLKSEVERNLPPKKEYLLYAPLTQQQKDFYQAIVGRNHRQYLINAIAGVNPDSDEVEDLLDEETPNGARPMRQQERVDYRIEENDSKYIRNLEKKAEEKSRKVVAKPKTSKELQAMQIRDASESPNNQRALLTLSQTGQQHASAEPHYAVAQDLITSVPVQLAQGS